MIRAFRSLFRIARTFGFLVGFTARMRLRQPPPDSPDYETWRREYFGGACRGILRRLNARVEVDGTFPLEGGFLVTNHLGYFDVLVLASLGPVVFVSRADVEHWPLVGRLTKWCSTIYIDRARREQIPSVVDEMRSALATGSQVVFFPEGTSGPGDAVMPFRASLFDAASAGDVPVRVGALSYATRSGDPAAREAVCWWGDAGFARHFFRLAGLSQITAKVTFPDGVYRSADRKVLAQQCRDAVQSAFVPVTGSGDR